MTAPAPAPTSAAVPTRRAPGVLAPNHTGRSTNGDVEHVVGYAGVLLGVE
ncbi:MAG TPA: hypothetical protein VF761_05615 [Gemmatimonadaceae bacterium]